MIILYIMLHNWRKFKGWQVLEFFLENNESIHVNGLAKKLKIGASTAQTYLTEYEKEGVLEKDHNANVVNYKLKTTPFTLELKKALIVSKLMVFAREFKKENIFATSLWLYGSHAKGTYDKKSD